LGLTSDSPFVSLPATNIKEKQKDSGEFRAFCTPRLFSSHAGWVGEAEKNYCKFVLLFPMGRISTYGLRGSFGFCRFHVQVGHHGLQALFVFCKLVGKEKRLRHFFEYRSITILTPKIIHIPNSYGTISI
jgi:hypothetical protein